jgi:uncharacterized paraquat-inducible protein A
MKEFWKSRWRRDEILTKRCPRCNWLFQLPLYSQSWRIYCRACESKIDASRRYLELTGLSDPDYDGAA